mgnify:CR=1 FL=1
MEYRCITNNPIMVDSEFHNVEFKSVDNLDLFLWIEGEVCKGYRLLTHPLTGSIRPDISPYKSVLLSKNTAEIDNESIELIHKAIDYTYSLAANHKKPDWRKEEREDFQFVDRSFIRYALELNQ